MAAAPEVRIESRDEVLRLVLNRPKKGNALTPEMMGALTAAFAGAAEYVGLRFGDITVPYIRVGEPLRIECDHFLQCVRDRKQPLSDGLDGLRVVEVLEAADASLAENGAPIALGGSCS